MSEPASEVYAIVLEEMGARAKSSRGPFARVLRLISKLQRATESGAIVISVIRKDGGEEVFRHIEEMGDDEDHLLGHIQRDLASMTAQEFAARWTS